MEFRLQNGRLHDEKEEKKQTNIFFSALLMINVLIFLDMVWFGF